jgi:hypothetical protein
MRTILLAIVLATPVVLGGCAAGNLQGNSLLPTTSQAVHFHHNSDSVGGGPPSLQAAGVFAHNTDSVGGGPPKVTGGAFQQGSDSVGGGPPAQAQPKLDSVGGGPPAKPVKHTKMHHDSGDSVGGGPPSH